MMILATSPSPPTGEASIVKEVSCVVGDQVHLLVKLVELGFPHDKGSRRGRRETGGISPLGKKGEKNEKSARVGVLLRFAHNGLERFRSTMGLVFRQRFYFDLSESEW